MKNIDKTEAEKRLAAIETEAQKLRELINEADKPKPYPKKGEVWGASDSRRRFLYTEDREHVELASPGISDEHVEIYSNDSFPEHAGTRLGTFSEVYIERSAVRATIKEVLECEDAWTERNEGCWTNSAAIARRKLEGLL